VKDTKGNAVAAATLGTFAIAVQPKLAITTQPGATAVAGKANAQAMVVKIEDQAGTVLATDVSSVTISVASGPSSMITGTATIAAVKGVATFSNLQLTKSGSYTLKAADGLDTPATSSAVKVTPAAAAQLAFTKQPAPVKVGVAIAPAVTVAVEDAFGNIVTTDHSNIVISIATAVPTGGVLSGTLTVADVLGVSSFSTLKLSKIGSYTLKATDGLLTSVISTSVMVS
jgi:hypothetical protein